MNIILRTPLIKFLHVFFTAVILSGCASYTVTTESLTTQLENNQDPSVKTHFTPYTVTDYPSNNLSRIKCVDIKGNQVWLYPDKNTEFRITRRSTDNKVRAYFDTLILKNDTLFGLRSRIIGGLRVVPVADIEKIEIYAEMPRTEKIK